MIKMTMFLKRKAELTHEVFVGHHIQQHGPLFRSIPEAAQHVLRYSTASGDVSPVQNADFDGTAEIWFDSIEGMRAVLTSPAYKSRVYADEFPNDRHRAILRLRQYLGGILDVDQEVAALIGPSGAGKSTFARRHFSPFEVPSSDGCRGLVADNENEQCVRNSR